MSKKSSVKFSTTFYPNIPKGKLLKIGLPATAGSGEADFHFEQLVLTFWTSSFSPRKADFHIADEFFTGASSSIPISSPSQEEVDFAQRKTEWLKQLPSFQPSGGLE